MSERQQRSARSRSPAEEPPAEEPPAAPVAPAEPPPALPVAEEREPPAAPVAPAEPPPAASPAVGSPESLRSLNSLNANIAKLNAEIKILQNQIGSDQKTKTSKNTELQSLKNKINAEANENFKANALYEIAKNNTSVLNGETYSSVKEIATSYINLRKEVEALNAKLSSNRKNLSAKNASVSLLRNEQKAYKPKYKLQTSNFRSKLRENIIERRKLNTLSRKPNITTLNGNQIATVTANQYKSFQNIFTDIKSSYSNGEDFKIDYSLFSPFGIKTNHIKSATRFLTSLMNSKSLEILQTVSAKTLQSAYIDYVGIEPNNGTRLPKISEYEKYVKSQKVSDMSMKRVTKMFTNLGNHLETRAVLASQASEIGTTKTNVVSSTTNINPVFLSLDPLDGASANSFKENHIQRLCVLPGFVQYIVNNHFFGGTTVSSIKNTKVNLKTINSANANNSTLIKNLQPKVIEKLILEKLTEARTKAKEKSKVASSSNLNIKKNKVLQKLNPENKNHVELISSVHLANKTELDQLDRFITSPNRTGENQVIKMEEIGKFKKAFLEHPRVIYYLSSTVRDGLSKEVINKLYKKPALKGIINHIQKVTSAVREIKRNTAQKATLYQLYSLGELIGLKLFGKKFEEVEQENETKNKKVTAYVTESRNSLNIQIRNGSKNIPVILKKYDKYHILLKYLTLYSKNENDPQLQQLASNAENSNTLAANISTIQKEFENLKKTIEQNGNGKYSQYTKLRNAMIKKLSDEHTKAFINFTANTTVDQRYYKFKSIFKLIQTLNGDNLTYDTTKNILKSLKLNQNLLKPETIGAPKVTNAELSKMKTNLKNYRKSSNNSRKIQISSILIRLLNQNENTIIPRISKNDLSVVTINGTTHTMNNTIALKMITKLSPSNRNLLNNVSALSEENKRTARQNLNLNKKVQSYNLTKNLETQQQIETLILDIKSLKNSTKTTVNSVTSNKLKSALLQTLESEWDSVTTGNHTFNQFERKLYNFKSKAALLTTISTNSSVENKKKALKALKLSVKLLNSDPQSNESEVKELINNIKKKLNAQAGISPSNIQIYSRLLHILRTRPNINSTHLIEIETSFNNTNSLLAIIAKLSNSPNNINELRGVTPENRQKAKERLSLEKSINNKLRVYKSKTSSEEYEQFVIKIEDMKVNYASIQERLKQPSNLKLSSTQKLKLKDHLRDMYKKSFGSSHSIKSGYYKMKSILKAYDNFLKSEISTSIITTFLTSLGLNANFLNEPINESGNVFIIKLRDYLQDQLEQENISLKNTTFYYQLHEALKDKSKHKTIIVNAKKFATIERGSGKVTKLNLNQVGVLLATLYQNNTRVMNNLKPFTNNADLSEAKTALALQNLKTKLKTNKAVTGISLSSNIAKLRALPNSPPAQAGQEAQNSVITKMLKLIEKSENTSNIVFKLLKLYDSAKDTVKASITLANYPKLYKTLLHAIKNLPYVKGETYATLYKNKFENKSFNTLKSQIDKSENINEIQYLDLLKRTKLQAFKEYIFAKNNSTIQKEYKEVFKKNLPELNKNVALKYLKLKYNISNVNTVDLTKYSKNEKKDIEKFLEKIRELPKNETKDAQNIRKKYGYFTKEGYSEWLRNYDREYVKLFPDQKNEIAADRAKVVKLLEKLRKEEQANIQKSKREQNKKDQALKARLERNKKQREEDKNFERKKRNLAIVPYRPLNLKKIRSEPKYTVNQNMLAKFNRLMKAQQNTDIKVLSKKRPNLSIVPYQSKSDFIRNKYYKASDLAIRNATNNNLVDNMTTRFSKISFKNNMRY